MEPEGKQRKRWTRVERLAYHEAGHAVMCHLLGGQSFEVTIIPDEKEGTLGHHQHLRALELFDEHMHPEAEEVEVTRSLIEAAETQILALLAGQVAEKLVTRRSDHRGASADHKQAADLALLATGGNHRCALWCLGYLNLKAEVIMREALHLVRAVASALLEKRHLGRTEIASVIQKAEEREALARRVEEAMKRQDWELYKRLYVALSEEDQQ